MTRKSHNSGLRPVSENQTRLISGSIENTETTDDDKDCDCDDLPHDVPCWECFNAGLEEFGGGD
jgi:hypothetical protein